MNDIVTVVTFVGLGTVGGIANTLIWAESWADLKKFSTFKTTVLGSVAGLLYYFLHTEYNFPNFIMSLVSGYFGKDFVQGIMEKFKKKE